MEKFIIKLILTKHCVSTTPPRAVHQPHSHAGAGTRWTISESYTVTMGREPPLTERILTKIRGCWGGIHMSENKQLPGFLPHVKKLFPLGSFLLQVSDDRLSDNIHLYAWSEEYFVYSIRKI